MDDRKREVRVSADSWLSLSVEYTVFIQKIVCESVERHRVKSRSHARSSASREFADVRGLNEQHFHELRKKLNLETDGAAVLGHTDSSSGPEHSTPEVV
jgi:hypothetical protein